MTTVRRFLVHQGGATAIEYCFIAASIALVIFASLGVIGGKLNHYFVQIAAVN